MPNLVPGQVFISSIPFYMLLELYTRKEKRALGPGSRTVVCFMK